MSLAELQYDPAGMITYLFRHVVPIYWPIFDEFYPV